jgi:hypothetical protein
MSLLCCILLLTNFSVFMPRPILLRTLGDCVFRIQAFFTYIPLKYGVPALALSLLVVLVRRQIEMRELCVNLEKVQKVHVLHLCVACSNWSYLGGCFSFRFLRYGHKRTS